MKRLSIIIAGAILLSPAPVWAEQAAPIMIHDAYARAASPAAKAGAIFMELMNKTDQPDRLIAAQTAVARRVELHTHLEDDAGVMRMREDKDGFEIPAQGMHRLARGGDHVMLMGLTGPLDHGDVIEVTLIFENAGDITWQVPVDLERKGGHEGHGSTQNH